MSTSTLAIPARKSQGLARVGDFVELTKPKIGALVLVTVAVSAVVASWGQPDPLLLFHALIGTALVAASASSLNHFLERDSDSRMERTQNRPLPAGRLAGREVLLFGGVTIFAGIGYLALTAGMLTAALGTLSWFLYVCVYTPMKSRSTSNTLVGAVAGAMPALIGWSAVGGRLDLRAATLFLIVFLWQFPHFMAIAWLYRRQYAAAGLKMLTVVDPSGQLAGLQAVLAALALLPVSFLPALSPAMATARPMYLVAALLLGMGQLWCALVFCGRLDETAARRLLRASLVYLPALLALLMFIPLV